MLSDVNAFFLPESFSNNSPQGVNKNTYYLNIKSISIGKYRIELYFYTECGTLSDGISNPVISRKPRYSLEF